MATWADRSECRSVDKSVFFGGSDEVPMSRVEVRTARSICFLCPVRRDCLEFALSNEETWGVWGGLTGSERQRSMHVYKTVAGVLAAYDEGALEQKVVLRGPR